MKTDTIPDDLSKNQNSDNHISNSRIFHYREYEDKLELYRLKKDQNLRISVGIPTFNEMETIGQIVEKIRLELMSSNMQIVDEVAIIDSGSTDSTRKEAIMAGAKFYLADNYMLEVKPCRGKGENLWKSLYVLQGDIIVWIDADIKNFHTGYITGLIGPLLENKELLYSTAFYRRPLQLNNGDVNYDGGRVTELLVRPFLSYFIPELADFFQPMSGEHAGRRELLEKLRFFTGYSVDVAILADITSSIGKNVIAQVNLGERIHRNRDIQSLSKEAFGVLQTLVNLAVRWNRLEVFKNWTELYGIDFKGESPFISSLELIEKERLPIINYENYKCKFTLSN